MEEVPRRTSLAPLVSPCFLLCLIGMEARAGPKSGWLEVDQELDMGWPTFDTNISVLKLQESLLQ